ILETGDLKERVLVFDWANSGDFSRWQITDLTFSQDGDMYVGTNKDSDPVLIVDPAQGTTKPLLSVYKGVFASPTTQLCWGNGNYLYVNRLSDAGAGVKRIVMGKKGAPYYGRQ
ncbi:MAG: hypothetical protein ONB05_11605, partial [candidate division KSB1 bacterium]|nr:hypothetical protein [candidate division KSB1 bacterium]